MEAPAASCQPTHHVNKIQKENKTHKGANSYTKSLCYNCVQSWPHRNRESCPAFGKTCRGCGKVNHLESVCRNKSNTSRARYQPSTASQRWTLNPRSKVNLLHVENCSDSSTDEYVYSINGLNITKQPKFCFSVCGRNILFTADSGASVNVMDERDYNRLEQKPNLIPTNVKIFSYGSQVPIPVLGTFTDTVRNGSYSTIATFFVVTGSCGSLLGWNTSTKLRLINVVNAVTSQPCSSSVDAVIKEYEDLFRGLGKLKNFQVKLHIDETVQPVAQPRRRVPFHVRKQLENQLRSDEALGVIERASGQTPWVSPLVVVPKPRSPGQVRVCVDMRQANVAIR